MKDLTINEVLRSLENVRALSETKWIASCPNPEWHRHGDANPSFAVSLKEDGSVLVHCFAGCTQATVWKCLRERVGPDKVAVWRAFHRAEAYPLASREFRRQHYLNVINSPYATDEEKLDHQRRFRLLQQER